MRATIAMMGALITLGLVATADAQTTTASTSVAVQKSASFLPRIRNADF